MKADLQPCEGVERADTDDVESQQPRVRKRDMACALLKKKRCVLLLLIAVYAGGFLFLEPSSPQSQARIAAWQMGPDFKFASERPEEGAIGSVEPPASLPGPTGAPPQNASLVGALAELPATTLTNLTKEPPSSPVRSPPPPSLPAATNTTNSGFS